MRNVNKRYVPQNIQINSNIYHLYSSPILIALHGRVNNVKNEFWGLKKRGEKYSHGQKKFKKVRGFFPPMNFPIFWICFLFVVLPTPNIKIFIFKNPGDCP